MTALMVQGCSSCAGKSLLVTALCRWFADRGVRVAPFKAQNMSNNARVVNGGEVGTAQWLQARAARVAPEVAMNPVLLRPETDTTSQVVRLGQIDETLTRLPWRDLAPALWPTITGALDDLFARFDLVLIEGAGSPAEINLADDVANMRVADRADTPVVLVVDIDRGGAFAHLYGTWALLTDAHRRRVRGFVLNRFRGDPDSLAPGPAGLHQLTRVPTLGVLPMLDHDLPDEDGATRHRPAGGGMTVGIVRYPTASTLDEFTLLEQAARLRWVRRADQLADVDLVILPGSNNPIGDLTWLRGHGLAEPIRAAAATGTRVLGIGGGLQMLGRRLYDPATYHEPVPGLDLLAVQTHFAPTAQTAATTTRFTDDLPGPWSELAGLQVQGYEIRHGRTIALQTTMRTLPAGRGWADGNVHGIYLHGLLEDPAVLGALTGDRPTQTLEDTFQTLATAVDTHLDMTTIRQLAGI